MIETLSLNVQNSIFNNGGNGSDRATGNKLKNKVNIINFTGYDLGTSSTNKMYTNISNGFIDDGRQF